MSARAWVFGLVLSLPASASPVAAQTTAYEQLHSFSAMLAQVRQNYVDSVDLGRLVQASIRGMLTSLDPHSYYATREDFELRMRWDRGELAAPGLSLEDAGSNVMVLGTDPDGPAAQAGVLAGDRVLRLNDSVVAGMGARTLEVRLFGEKGSKVRMTFERGSIVDPDTFAVTLKRILLDHRVVGAPELVNKATGYLRLAQFTQPAPKELAYAIKKVQGMGAKQLILDLRGNPGGDIGAMIAVASLFLPSGVEIFHTTGRMKGAAGPVVTNSDGSFASLPLILLVDAGSASAAEVLAGSLQDHDRGLVVGSRSFGKALIQTSLPLPNGDVVWLTTARVITPSGRTIQRRYAGLGKEQYYALAGKSGAAEDTLTVFKTDAGRSVRGGGGIVPDIELRSGGDLPVWFSMAADSGFDAAVADSVAATLPKGSDGEGQWRNDRAAWDSRLVVPFLARVRTRLGVRGEPEAGVRDRLALILALRVAGLRWGPEAGERFLVRNDGAVGAATALFPRLPELLAPSPATR